MKTNERSVRKRKVLYVITKSDIGGAQKYARDLAQNLDQARFKTKIIYGGSDVRWLSNKVWWWALLANDWFAIVELVQIFRRERPDVIHLNSSKAGVIGSFAAGIYKVFTHLSKKNNSGHSDIFKSFGSHKPPKVVFTAHGWVFNPSNYHPVAVRRFYVLLHRIAAMFQDVIINVSEFDRSLALRYRIAPHKKLVTVYNGIDQNISFLDKKTAREEILKKIPAFNFQPPISNIQSPVSNVWIGSIGRLTKEKSYETLIEAASLIHAYSPTPDIQKPTKTNDIASRKCLPYFFIIGSGPELPRLKQLIAQCELQNKFFIVPPTGDDARYLKAFDVFTMTSIKEGLPYTLLEAMAAALPCVATAIGGMPEMVVHKPLVVPAQNPTAIAKSLKLLLNNEVQRPALGRALHERLCRHFSASSATRATAELYES